MKKMALLLGVGFLMSFLVSANATVVTFDDISDNGGWMDMPTGYAGLNWGVQYDQYGHVVMTQWGVCSDTANRNLYGNTYLTPSSPMMAFNNFERVEVWGDAAFDFNGAYFCGFGYNDQPLDSTATSITVIGGRNNSVVGMVSMDLPADHFVWLTANFVGIDWLLIDAPNAYDPIAAPYGGYWSMDNFTYNEPMGVPDGGSSAVLLSFGTLALGLLRRRMQA
jgi:hypothetical protein